MPSRVLFISGTPLVPPKKGPARRNHHLIEQLCRFYEVSVLAVGTEADADAFAATFAGRVARATIVPSVYPRASRPFYKVWWTLLGHCDFLPALEPALHRACAELTAQHRFDAIILSSVLLRRLPLTTTALIISDAHNVEFDVLRRMAAAADGFCRRQYARRQARLTEREEGRCAGRVDLMLATSERDRDLFRRQFRQARVDVVPNGIDLSEFRPAATTVRQPVLVFTGLLSYYPNQQGIRWFLDTVFPEVVRRMPAVRLVIGGADPPRWLRTLHDARVEVTGEVPDMRPHLARAAVVIVPLHIGGGTRVKILEALAMARPVVSTSIGAEGLGLKHGQSIVIADEAAPFAAHVVRLLQDAGEADRLAANGRREVCHRFDWDHIGEQLAQRLGERCRLIAREPRPAANRPLMV